MEKITSDLHTVVCHDILKALSSYLPMSHMTILDGYLAEVSIAEAQLMKIRFDSMPEEQFPILGTKLANVAIDKFCSYLRISVTAPHYAYFPNGVVLDHDQAHVECESDKTTAVLSAAGKAKREAHELGQTINDGEGQLSNSQTDLALSLRKCLFGDNGVPQDIYDTLVETLFRSFYLRGTLVPSQYVDSDGHSYFADDGVCLEKSRVFHDIDLRLYNRYKDLYWSRNTWYVSGGKG